jgi:hypothetical protein
MFLSRSTSRLYIKSKLRKIKGIGRNSKDRGNFKGYRRRTKANKGIGSKLGYY